MHTKAWSKNSKFFVFALTVFLLGITVGRSFSQTPEYIVSDLGFVKSSSYILAQYGTTYYTIDGTYGTLLVSGTDASTVIATTVSAMSSGQTLFVKAGTYIISSKVLFNKQISVLGEGKKATFQSTISNGDPVFEFNVGAGGIWNIRLADFRIIGGGSEGYGILFYNPVRSNIISNLRILDVGGGGIHVQDGYDMRIEYCFISGAGEAGIYADDSNAITVFGSTLRTSKYGILLHQQTGALVSGCEFGSATKAELYLNNSVSVNIESNYFEAINKAIVVSGVSDSYSKSVDIDANYFNIVEGTDRVNVEIDYGKSVTYGQSNRQVDDIAYRFNITDNAGSEYEPITVYFVGNMGDNVNWTYLQQFDRSITTSNSVSFTSIANGTYVAHGLSATPEQVIISLSVRGYAWYGATNSTHVQIYGSATTLSGSMYSAYNPYTP